MLARQLLPGVTVSTTRARYLSFLCWAIRKTDNNAREIDKWEIALSVGEYLRGSARCLGIGLLKEKKVERGTRVPLHLHVQTARVHYSGLLRSCNLFGEDGKLTGLGDKIADEFGRRMPKSLPRQVFRCEEMPSLSEIGPREIKYLCNGLLEEGCDNPKRRQTFQEVGVPHWRKIHRNTDVSWLLKEYLPRVPRASTNAGEPGRFLHAAARLELQAMPLSRLFLYLYQHTGLIRGGIPKISPFRAYRVREAPEELLADVAAHLRMATRLGALRWRLNLPSLKQWLLKRHREEAKHEAPWVDNDWHVLRPGLSPQQLPNVHEYRLRAFASLCSDLRLV